MHTPSLGTQRLADGSICVDGNYAPCWTDLKCTYQVLGKWPETLWKQRKISHETYREYLHLSRDGVVSRKRNLEAVVDYEHKATRAQEIADRVSRIRSNLALFQAFAEVPDVTAWLAKFKQDALRGDEAVVTP